MGVAHIEPAVGGCIRVVLRKAFGVDRAHANLEPVPSFPIAVDFSFAAKAKTAAAVVVRHDRQVVFNAIVPVHDGFIHLAIDFEANLAVALARGCRFEFGNAFLEVGAATPAKICGGSRQNRKG